ncbi:hypothetical protein PRIPAC_73942 [Pristionchus pacificus]|uniref:Uncharacterized protein n=1 Tax=Pristionchus pacificus TaxID=54126 RepID=A0A2A6CS36_PRIPA|nr:hypothetical protein PRIPAC_73942 [Pristionchus pacificus]|eukprot:PDM81015.1 hypothetical protein PRIPAC_36018 [Pristionchus pacificus]
MFTTAPSCDLPRCASTEKKRGRRRRGRLAGKTMNKGVAVLGILAPGGDNIVDSKSQTPSSNRKWG